MAKATKCDNRLTGKFFLTFKDGECYNQGRIISKVGSEAYLVQLFSWLTGYATTQEVRMVESMSSEKWRLYSDENDWRDDGQRYFDRKCA
jgi:hypothetical protein